MKPNRLLKTRNIARTNSGDTVPCAAEGYMAEALSSEKTENAALSGTATEVAAKIDVGFGNQLFIRGQGDGLSWDKGAPLVCRDSSTWVWSTPHAREKITFKLLLNDRIWAQGPDLVAEVGARTETVPQF